MSALVELWIWLLADVKCRVAVVSVVPPPVSLKSISGGQPSAGHSNSTCVDPGPVTRERMK
jgi:hypothetical protein